jgi:hypothetical protein
MNASSSAGPRTADASPIAHPPSSARPCLLARRSLGCGQQARLADAGLAAKDHGVTAGGRVVQERGEETLFPEATQKRRGFMIGRAKHDPPHRALLSAE